MPRPNRDIGRHSRGLASTHTFPHSLPTTRFSQPDLDAIQYPQPRTRAAISIPINRAGHDEKRSARSADGQMAVEDAYYSPSPSCHFQIDLCCVISTEPTTYCHLMSTGRRGPVPRLHHHHNLVRPSAGSTRFAFHIAGLRCGRRLMGSSSRRLQVRSTSQGIPGAMASRPPLRVLGGQDRMQLLETWWSLFAYAKI